MSNLNLKIWTRIEIENLIRSSDLAAMRAVCAIFRKQTRDEQQVLATEHLNHRGFTAAHAKAGSVLARWMTAGREDGQFVRACGGHMVFGGRLVSRIEVARRIALVHVGQVVDEANNNERRRFEQAAYHAACGS